MHEGKMFGKHGGNVNWLADHAEMLGMTTDELQTALDAGQRPHEIAESQGVTIEQMHEFMQNKMKEHVASLVAAGTITQEQADLRLQHMEEKSGDFENNGQFHKRGGLGQKNMFSQDNN
jgi:DNA-directed RNA polymerase specialized sigma subunit